MLGLGLVVMLVGGVVLVWVIDDVGDLVGIVFDVVGVVLVGCWISGMDVGIGGVVWDVFDCRVF